MVRTLSTLRFKLRETSVAGQWSELNYLWAVARSVCRRGTVAKQATNRKEGEQRPQPHSTIVTGVWCLSYGEMGKGSRRRPSFKKPSNVRNTFSVPADVLTLRGQRSVDGIVPGKSQLLLAGACLLR